MDGRFLLDSQQEDVFIPQAAFIYAAKGWLVAGQAFQEKDKAC
jgi:hypothetical protein